MQTSEANELLPDKPTEILTDSLFLKYLLIAPPKWGKTTWFLSFTEALLLATEEGHAFHKAHKIIIEAWNKVGWGTDDQGNRHTSMVEACDAVVTSDKFKFVVIDTADMAAKLCLDYSYKELRVNHASEAGDYGKGWDIALTQPYRREIGKLMKSGRGIGFTTHTNIIEKKVGQSTVSRMETSLPSQVQKFLHTQADLILHGFFGKKREGMVERDRIISMDGTNEILAGTRVRGIRLPKKFIVDPENPFKQWQSFFEDEDASLQAEKDYENLYLRGREAEEVAAAVAEETISGNKTEPETATTRAAKRKARK